MCMRLHACIVYVLFVCFLTFYMTLPPAAWVIWLPAHLLQIKCCVPPTPTPQTVNQWRLTSNPLISQLNQSIKQIVVVLLFDTLGSMCAVVYLLKCQFLIIYLRLCDSIYLSSTVFFGFSSSKLFSCVRIEELKSLMYSLLYTLSKDLIRIIYLHRQHIFYLV